VSVAHQPRPLRFDTRLPTLQGSVGKRPTLPPVLGVTPLPVFVAFAAFMLILYGHHFGLRVPPLPGFEGLFRAPRKSAGQKSGVRTDALEMVLDHDSGHMDGRCLKGRFAGRALSSLRDEDLLLLLEEISATDPQGAALLEAYLDRRCRGWRERRSGGDAREEPRHPRDRAGHMSRKEAYDVLGLEAGAAESEIRAAHRRLMMKLHPDQGGSTYLACRINEAKDVLLARK
jgi:DnaJ domain